MKMKEILYFFMHRLLSRNMVNQRGSSMVEFALVLPLLMVFLFGIIEFSLVAYNKQVITNAAREGARAGIVARNTPMTSSDIEGIAQNYALDNLITFGNNSTPNVIVNNTSGQDFGDPLEVTVEFDYQFLVFPNVMTLLKSFNWQSTMPLEGTSVMLYE